MKTLPNTKVSTPSPGQQYPADVLASANGLDQPYRERYLEGWQAKHDGKAAKTCPYTLLGQRCAWLAGFND